MKKPTQPDNEPARLQALRGLNILDTEAEERFDRVTRIAKYHFGVDIALVSLVDAQRQWFKSRQGLAATETHRDISFCGHAILDDETFIVEDASTHRDFADNPLVAGAPNIRFYAGAPLHAPGGARVGTLCIIDSHPRHLSEQDRNVLRDLANCVEMELALTAIREREHFLHELADATPGLVAYWDKDLVCRFANRPYLEWFGRKPEELIGSTIQELLGPALFKMNEPYIRGALAGAPQQFERTLRKADGTTGHTWAHYVPDRRNGTVCGFFVLVTDVTPLKIAENKIRAAEAHLKAILDNIEEGIVTFDRNGVIETATHSIEAMFRRPMSDLLGANVRALVPEVELPPSADKSRRELTARTKEGDGFPVDIAISEMASGDRTVFVGVIRNITDRRRTIQELEVAKAMAERANRAKDRFLAIVSHEIRTPITAVLGMADLLRASPLDPEQKGWLQQLTRSTNSLLGLINDILDFSKIAAGMSELERVHFSLTDIVRETCSLVSALAVEKHNTITVAFEPGLRPAYCGDSKKYRQVLMNLLSNANKFTSGGKIAVSVAAAPGDARAIETRVEDSGIGIAPENQARLFDPFVQEDVSTSRKYGGTGLGLSICKRFVELMGGQIKVHSTLGKGSVFTFTVLLDPGEAAKIEREAPAEAAAPSATTGLRVLAAEDDATIRTLIETVLSRSGYSVTAVSNGAEAVEEAKRRPYDIILMDMQMPIMDGPDAMRAIRAGSDALRTVPIIALTADALQENQDAYLESGASLILTKPIAWPQLLSEIRRLTTGAARPDRATR
ncbi:MAG: ATP-binding protein [Rhizomicrobium sp.]